MAMNGKPKWHRKPSFGSLYTTKGSPYIYISMNYYKERLRFPTDLEDTPENWSKVSEFMSDVGHKIKNGTFIFAKAFYWLDEDTKKKFSRLEGNDYRPEPQHIKFGEYAEKWVDKKFPEFTASKRELYRGGLRATLPYFQDFVFAAITTVALEDFIDLYICGKVGSGGRGSKAKNSRTSVKRIKDIMIPMHKIWRSACNANNWNLPNPFQGLRCPVNNGHAHLKRLPVEC